VVARRVLKEMERLALDRTIRAGVVALHDDCDAAVAAARAAAEAAPAGAVALAPVA
jgi:hypothetical protein